MTRDELIKYIQNNHLARNGKLNAKKPIPKELYQLIINETADFDISYSISDRVNLLLLGINKAPICPTCNVNKLKFTKYRTFTKNCSKTCAAKNLERNKKIQSKIDYNQISRDKKQANLEKFGVEYYFQTNEFKKKSKSTLIKKYSATNISNVDAIKEKKKITFEKNFNEDKKQDLFKKRGESISQKFPNTTIVKENLEELLKNYTPIQISKKFGLAFSTVYNYISDDVKLHKQYIENRSSSYELQISNLLDEMKIKYVKNDRQQIAPYELDLYCPDYNLAIEVNGIYFHHDERLPKNYHLNKTTQCNLKNIHLIHLWDTQIDADLDLIKSLLQTQFYKVERKIFARNCQIKILTQEQYKKFCENNHVQGYCSASVKLGLFFENKLVSAMSFGHSRFNKKAQWELTRFCNSKYTTVVGGASKLFKYFVKKYDPEKIISYCERSIFTGNLYQTLGFQFLHFSKPNYFYYKRGILESRNKFQKHRLSKILLDYNPDLTEYENMKNNGYKRVWDCGQSVWLWERT